MQDLNDLFIFSQVVEHNGFTGAARTLGLARSSICRRVAQLEEQLGVRLVHRSTRQFAVTALGRELHGDCLKMMAEAQAAYDRVACARATPSGLIRMCCPPLLAQLLVNPLIPVFCERHPEVRIAIEATNRKIELEDSFDLSLRLQCGPSEDSGLVMRSLGTLQHVLVASPLFLDRYGRPTSLSDAARLPTLSHGAVQGPHLWKMVGEEGRELLIRHEPKFIADDLVLIRQAAVQDLGIAYLPVAVCLEDIRHHALEVLLPELRAQVSEVQILFPSRRGILPSVRAFIDFLSAHSGAQVAQWRIEGDSGSSSAKVDARSRSVRPRIAPVMAAQVA